MANLVQLKMLEDLDGFLLVDKPEGIAFASVVKAVKRKFNLVKVGHGGSLDAMASGLFVLLIGDANKLVERVMGADREYAGALRPGGTTDTGDCHGRPVDVAPQSKTLAELAAGQRGDVFQTEPRFAAIRREGTAEYDVVDTGEHSQFLGHVYRFELSEPAADGTVGFSLLATKGVLPRAMAIDMGATLVSLRRTKVGRFDVADAVPFDKLLATEAKDFASLVKPMRRMFE